MRLVFIEKAWEDHVYWQIHDKDILKKVNSLIKECLRDPFHGIGKPEPLRSTMSGWWSRRISDKHRLVYKREGDNLIISECKGHYQ